VYNQHDNLLAFSMNTSTPKYRSECALSSALDVIGDKWSLIVVRDMCMNKTKYGDFLSSSEGIPTNILANRLRRLEADGIVEKKPYQLKPLRYEYFLTVKGANLLPVLQQLAIWAHKHVPECGAPPDWFLDAKPDNLTKTKE
jgi:DNA-binding HxlR family transcriptional regulator